MSQQQPHSPSASPSQSHATDAAHSPAGSAGSPGSAGSAGGPASRAAWPSAETGPGPGPAPSVAPGWVTGGLVFAGVLMLVNGLLAILQGISALAEDDVYGRIGDYVFEINLTAWGWILLTLGVVVACAGYGILKGAWWARITGIFVASLSMVLHFLFLPYTPVWSVIMVGVDFFVILALAVAPDVPRAGAGAGAGASASTRGSASTTR